MSHPWRKATAIAVAEKRERIPGNHRIISEYEEFFSRPVGAHIDIAPEDLNRWRCAGETRKAWYQAKRRKNGKIRFWNLGARV
jgi:hypothetical protein